jgi:hypothetical protein
VRKTKTMNKRKPSGQTAAMDPEGEGLEPKPVAKLGPDVKARIGQQLRLMYSEVVSQGVPERFVVILRGLDDPTDGGPHHEPS